MAFGGGGFTARAGRKGVGLAFGLLGIGRSLAERADGVHGISQSVMVENFRESEKDRDLDHTSGPRLHLPNRAIFSSS